MIHLRHKVSIAQAPAEARFELVGHKADLEAALKAAGLSVPAAAKAVARVGDVGVAWVGPRRWLISAPLSASRDMQAALSGAIHPSSSSILVDVTGSTVTFVLQGADTTAVLGQGIPHDLSIGSFPIDSVLATEGWGVALLLERDGERMRITVDVALAAYVSNCLSTAAGQTTDALPGVMRAPPPAISVSR